MNELPNLLPIPLEQTDPMVHWNLALGYQNRSEWGKAAAQWKNARGRGLNDTSIALQMAFCLEQSRHIPASLHALEAIDYRATLSKEELIEIELRKYALFMRAGLYEQAAQHRFLCEQLATLPRLESLGLSTDKQYTHQPLHGKKVLVVNHGGAGDQIDYARYLPALSQECEDITVVAHVALVDLLAHNFPGIRFLPTDRALPDISHMTSDYWCTFLSLAIHFNFNPWPAALPTDKKGRYLSVPETTQKKWENWVAQRLHEPNELRLGLNWQGHVSTDAEYQRNASPGDFAPFTSLLSTRCFGINRDLTTTQEAASAIHCPGKEIDDFCDLAGLIAAMDLVVTTCTAQAHLAGALGIPTLLLLGPKNDARWGMGTQTAFYPMMQIIRCSRAWQWDDGIDQVLSHIEAQRHATRPWTAFTV